MFGAWGACLAIKPSKHVINRLQLTKLKEWKQAQEKMNKSSLVNFSFFPPQGIRVIFNTKLICFHYPWIVHSIIWYKIMLTNPTCLVDLEKIKFECTSKSHNEYNVSLLHIFTPQNCIWNTIIFFWKEVIQKLCWPDFGIFRAPTYPWLTLLKTFSYFYVYEVLFMCQ